MRTFIRGSVVMLAAGLFAGCNSNMGSKPAAMSGMTLDKSATTPAVMQAGGVNVLKLTATSDFKCETADGSLHFKGPQELEIEVWLVRDAKTIGDGIAHADTQITDEFKDFKPDQTADLTIAGAPAKRLIGPGHEADDGDRGSADVIVFKVGDRIFIACYHGESLNPTAEQEMLTIVQTAQLP